MLSVLKDLSAGTVSGVFDGIRKLISEFHQSPEEKSKALQAVMDFETRLYQVAASIDLAQIETNREEAKHTSLFVSGWRPFVGWACGGGLAYEVIVRDLLNWILTVAGALGGVSVPLLPVVGSDILATTLLSMLGMASIRTFEKLRGVVRV